MFLGKHWGKVVYCLPVDYKISEPLLTAKVECTDYKIRVFLNKIHTCKHTDKEIYFSIHGKPQNSMQLQAISFI